jgi:synaptobrevin family protein YKT6
MRASRDKEFELSTLPGTLTRYQDPNVDPMMRVQKDLDETKAVMVKTMENLIGRGEKLEHLMETSNDLSGQAKLFHKQAKKTNSCCVLS